MLVLLAAAVRAVKAHEESSLETPRGMVRTRADFRREGLPPTKGPRVLDTIEITIISTLTLGPLPARGSGNSAHEVQHTRHNDRSWGRGRHSAGGWGKGIVVFFLV